MVPSDRVRDRRLSDVEALLWSLEADPALRSAFMGITFLEQAPDFERFRRRLCDAIAIVPALNHRVVEPPIDMLAPHWELDPSFDLDYHVRRIAVPPPGSRRQLLDLASVMCQDPLDRTRPLWQFTIVEGLEGGQAALLSKMDHVLSDGLGAIRMSSAFLDVTPDGPAEPAPLARASASSRSHPSSPIDPSAEIADPDIAAHTDEAAESNVPGGRGRSGVLGAMDSAGSALADNLGKTSRVAGDALNLVRRPQDLPRRALDTVTMGRSLARQFAVVDPAHSPLWTSRQSLARRFEVLSVELDTVRATAHALGGTVNDVFVTVISGAAGAYHLARHVEVNELRMSMPVSTRSNRSAAGNHWTPTRVLVPAGDPDPLRRFTEVHARLELTKHEPSIGLAAALTGLARGLPNPIVVRLARQQVGTVDFACSNVRGAPFDLWVAGARVLANHPMGPTAGTAFNATVLSYKGHFDVGLNVDSGAVDDPGELRERAIEGFAELAAAAGV